MAETEDFRHSKPVHVDIERQPLVLWGWPLLAAVWWALVIVHVVRDGWSWGEPLFVFAWFFAAMWTLLAFVVVRRHRRTASAR